MSYYIMIRGPLGCGKTTIAARLAKELKGVHVSVDKILEELKLDKVPPHYESVPLKNFLKGNEHIIPRAKQWISEGKVVVFDACFYNKEVIEHLLNNLKFPHYIFTLKAPVELCIKRDKGRKRIYGEDATSAVHMLVSRLDYGITIDATGTLEETLKKIKAHLPK